MPAFEFSINAYGRQGCFEWEDGELYESGCYVADCQACEAEDVAVAYLASFNKMFYLNERNRQQEYCYA